MAATMNVMTSTMMVLRRNMKTWNSAARHFFLARCRIGCRTAVFFQFVVKRLEADAENFCGPRLVVAGRLKCLKNKHLLRLFDSRANAQADRIGIVWRGAQGSLSEARGQMFGLDHAGV